MTEFIGLDLGMERSTLAVVDAAGKIVERAEVETTRKALKGYFGGRKDCRVLMEVGCESAWVGRELQALGLEVRCVNPRRLKMIAESTLKTDILDAEVLARLCRISSMDPELVREVKHRSETTQQERAVMVVRSAMVGSRTKLINTARGLARTMGYPLVGADAWSFAKMARKAPMPAAVREIIVPIITAIENLNTSIEAQEEQIAQLVAKHPIVQHLMAIDGVGPVVGLWFVLCVEDPTRFARPKDVGAYFGFRPRLRQSSSQRQTGSITKEGDAEMRRLLVQAAHCMLQTKKSSALQKWGKGLVNRLGRKKAIPAIARKISVVMLHLWQTGAVYERFPDQAAAA